MDVGCLLKLFVASTMKPQYHLLSPTPQLSKNSPPLAPLQQCKGARICPSTAYQGANLQKKWKVIGDVNDLRQDPQDMDIAFDSYGGGERIVAGI